MAHNLMRTEKGHAYAGARELAWHNLGVTTKDAMTSREAIELAQLDYEVGINPLHTIINNTSIPIVTHNVTYNKTSGNIFGVVGSRYEVIQNHEAFDFLDGIVKEKVAMFETAGALGLGETIFISVKLPNNVRLKSLPDEEINNYLLFTSSHDGSGTIKVLFTPVRVVCNNTLSAAIEMSTNAWSIKHTKNARNRLSNIQNLFEIAVEKINEMGLMLDKMANFRMTPDNIDAILASVILSKDEFVIEDGVPKLTKEISTNKNNLIYTVKKNIYTGVGQSILNPETAYGVYNGITTYLQNTKKYKTDEQAFTHINSKNNLSTKVYASLVDMMEKGV